MALTAEALAAPVERVQSDGLDPLPCVFVRLGRLVERRMNESVRGHGISAAHLIALSCLAGNPGASRAELARSMQVTPQAAGGIADKLVARGLITRTPSASGMSIELGLTEAGLRVIEQTRPKLDGLRRDILRLFRPNAAPFLDGALRHLLARF